MNVDSAEIVGREAELDRLAAFLGNPEALPGGLLIDGPAGAGKTTLWRASIERSEAMGYRVLACRPSGAEVRLAHAGLSDLLEPVVSEVLPGLPAPQRRALEVALLLRGDDGRPPDPRAIAAGFLSVVRELATTSPVLIAVDDAQWLDDATVEALEFTVRRVGMLPVAVIASRRTGSPTAPADDTARGLHLEAVRDRPVTRLRVDAMTVGAIYRILRTRTNLDVNRTLLRRIHETSGGNPFYALELAEAVERTTASGAHQPLPLSADLEELLASRVRELPPATRDMLFVASAVPEPTVELLAAVLGASLETTAMALRPAIAQGIVRLDHGRLDFRHPLLAAAAYTAVDLAERVPWHARIAVVASDPELRARHLALARPGPDREVAEQLHAAARAARARGAATAAAELYEESIRRLPTDPAVDRASARNALIVEAAPVIAASGAPDIARTLLIDAIAGLPTGVVRADARLVLAGLSESESRGGQRALELIDAALDDAGGEPARSAAALLAREMWVRHHGRLEDALPIARTALAFAEQSRDRRLLAEANVRTADLEVLLGLASEPSKRFERALALGRGVHIDAENSAPTMLAVCLIRAGRLDEARGLLLDQRAVAVAEGDEPSHQQLCLFLAELEWLAGRWDDASAYATEGLEVAEQAGLRLRQGSTTTLIALVEASRGDPERARALAVRARDICDEVEDVSYSRYARQVLAFLELSLGNAAAAVEDLATSMGEPEIEGPKRIAFTGDQVEALVQLGDLDGAAALNDAMTARGAILNRPPFVAAAARGRALVLAARGELEAALSIASEAVAAFEALAQPLDHARTLLVLGEVQRRAKQRRAARETLSDAIAAFDRLGAHLWSKRAAAERARIGGRSTIAGLTETEARVAALVADGKSNKEVAAELFVTVRAVEANLSKIYAKLGVRSRTELVRRI